jgi:hypothetical protein
MSRAASGSDNEAEIAVIAYTLWEARGCPEGSPEQDWFRAEQELELRRRTLKESTPEVPTTATTADEGYRAARAETTA